MHGKGIAQRVFGILQWPHYAVVIAASALLLGIQCRRDGPTRADDLYTSIERQFLAGNLTGAEAEWRRGASVIQASDVLWMAKFRVQQGRVRIYSGRNREAVELLESPLPKGSADGALATQRYALLSIAYTRLGDLSKAATALTEAGNRCPDELSRAGVLLARGVIEVHEGRLTDAEWSFEKSLASSRSGGDIFQQTQALLNLGVVALRQEHFDDALERFSQALALAKVIGARLAVEKAMGNIGWTYYKLGDFRRALVNSELASGEAAALGSPIDEATWLNDAGLSEYRLGEMDRAHALYQESYRLAQSIQDDEGIEGGLVALASVALQQKDFAGAYTLAGKAAYNAERRGNMTAQLQPLYLQAVALSRRGDVPEAEKRLLELRPKAKFKQSIAWLIEYELAKLSVEAHDQQSAERWFRRAIETFRTERTSVGNLESRLPFSENGRDLYLGYMEYLIEHGQVDQALQVYDESRAETLTDSFEPSFTRPTRFTRPESIARHLGGIILVYCLRPGHSYLWVVTRQQTALFRLPGNEVLLPLIQKYTSSILRSRDVQTQESSAGGALYRLLVEPARQQMTHGNKVFLVADDDLVGLSFESLLEPGPSSGNSDRGCCSSVHFWIETADIVNARSLSLLGRPRSHRQVVSKRLLMLGDPLYEQTKYSALAHASAEVASVAHHFTPANQLVLTGEAATPMAYETSKPETFGYIHFVAHGTANAENPLDSAVLLSSKKGETESYKLYARQIMQHSLDAELVTVSACYGSGSRSYFGEGLVGLVWAFLRAGSRNVVGALWEVSDTSTPQLMDDFYGNLMRGESPDSALRSAKLAMIRRGGVYRKPFYWAPFQLYVGG